MVTFWAAVILSQITLVPILGGFWLGMYKEKEDMKRLLFMSIEARRGRL